MDFPRTRRRIAERQIECCQRLIEKQREIIAQKKARGLDTVAAERLLTTLERSRAMFEEEIAALALTK